MARLITLIAALLGALCLAGAASAAPPIEVCVVIVTTWEAQFGGKDRFGELSAWETGWPLSMSYPFAGGVHPLLYDPKTHVLAIVTGEATARAAAAITALGYDPRFDLTHAYWIVAGIAGVDPAQASVGSAAWARWVVHGDLGQEIDPRDAPADWPTGMVPNGRLTPYAAPAPVPHGNQGGVVYALNAALADWAYARTKTIPLADDPKLATLRAPYSGPAARPPFVLEGDGLMSARFWYGPRLNAWAERWTSYWTGGKGVFVMSAEEDTGILQGLTQLAGAGKADLQRVLILRAASDYTVGPPGVATADFMAQEVKGSYPGTGPALANLYAVAAPVARFLADDWARTRTTLPTAAP
ncbi:MAG TPA: purine nucleoside permease [Caulobacteraceae bacterium]|nr:purine nucleoside permease [Caulobacteraceae bacterium]